MHKHTKTFPSSTQGESVCVAQIKTRIGSILWGEQFVPLETPDKGIQFRKLYILNSISTARNRPFTLFICPETYFMAK